MKTSVIAADWNTVEYVLQPPEPVTKPLLSKVAVGCVPGSTDTRLPRGTL
jgi:hypothetical protein